jgi:hypothetical protein
MTSRLKIEVGRDQAQAQLFHLFSKARARTQLILLIFQAQTSLSPKSKARVWPEPKKFRPDPPLIENQEILFANHRECVFDNEEWLEKKVPTETTTV